MTVELDLHTLAFWLSLGFLLFGALMGLLGVWVRELWNSEAATKLMITNWILFATSVGTAVISKWLGTG